MTLQKDPEGTETRALNQIVDFTGQRVLEIGCGDGRLTWRYAPSACRVTGIDLDTQALRAAVTDRPAGLDRTVGFMQADSLHLPFPHATFDIAILAWSF
jgi:ubiquinone/menaquinone biosynthesis C-methylase UbiE